MFSAQTARQQKGPRMANFRIPWGDVKNVRNMITQNSKGEKAPSEEAEEFIIHENCLASASAEEGEGGRDKRRLEASFVYFVCRDPPASSSREKRKSTARKERERHIYNSCVPRQRTMEFSFGLYCTFIGNHLREVSLDTQILRARRGTNACEDIRTRDAFFKQKLYSSNKKAVSGIIKTHAHISPSRPVCSMGHPRRSSSVPRNYFSAPCDSTMKYVYI